MTTTSACPTRDESEARPANSAARVATASFIGTAIEFYDFYVYATAAALVIGRFSSHRRPVPHRCFRRF